jgi:carbon-monoxide dehydrogenase small subunit
MNKVIKLNVNGEEYILDVEPNKTLLEILRDRLGLTGAKYSCGTGECGACSVIVDGKLVKSCIMLAVKANGKNILTIEGLTNRQNGRLHPLQESFMEHFAVQCGYCTPGMILASKSLLDENPNPTEEEVREYLSGNLCRCTGYVKIVDAVMSAKKKID